MRQQLTETIRVRVTPDDKAAFERAAYYCGLNISTWARVALKLRATQAKREAKK